MKKVLWVSRHEMTPTQRADLERIMGGPIELCPWRDTVKRAEELRHTLESCDAAAVVLPLDLLGQVLHMADGRPVLQAVSERRATGKTVPTPDGGRGAGVCLRPYRMAASYPAGTGDTPALIPHGLAENKNFHKP